MGGGQGDVELVKGPKNKFGSAFQKYEKDLTKEKEAQRLVDPMKARQWRIRNTTSKHPITGAFCALQSWKVCVSCCASML